MLQAAPGSFSRTELPPDRLYETVGRRRAPRGGGGSSSWNSWPWDDRVAVSSHERERPWYERLERYDDRARVGQRRDSDDDGDGRDNAYESIMQAMEDEMQEVGERHAFAQAMHQKRLSVADGRPIRTPLLGGKTPPAAALVALYRDTVAGGEAVRHGAERRRAADNRVIASKELLAYCAKRTVEEWEREQRLRGHDAIE